MYGNSKNHKSLVILTVIDSTNCHWWLLSEKHFCNTHGLSITQILIWKVISSPAPDLQPAEYVLICSLYYYYINYWEVRGQSHSSFLFRVRRASAFAPEPLSSPAGLPIKSHHPCSTAIHCSPPQRQNILEMMSRATSVNNGSSECMSSLWPLTISLVPQCILWANAAVKPMTIDRYE